MNRNILKKLGAVALSALMTLGVASQGISTVQAASCYVNYDGKSTAYGSTCGKFRINGRQAWCLEHKKSTPGSQNMNSEVYTSTEARYANIRKIMYFGWFGYEEWSGLQGKSDNEKNVIMSKALSHAYSGSSISKGIMTDFYNYATSKPDPLNQHVLIFSKQVVNTWYDQNAKIQKSESSRLNGPSGYHITINTQTNRVKLVNETRGWSGQVVDVYGGDTVHYEADAGYTGNAYSGWKKGGFQFAPLIAWNNDSSKQHVGTWVTIQDPLVSTCLNADFRAQLGSLKLRKTDTGGKLLDGAVFHVSGNGYEKDVTVTNGEITVNELPIGEYTITEKTAPNGYLVNVAPFKATVSAGQTAETTITDEAPTGKISIKKSDSKGNVQGEASLEGAEYTVYSADGQEVGKITTDKDGNGSLENLVLGTYTVKETKAPEAYDLDWNTYTVELTYKDQNTAIILGNVDSKENVKTGKIEIKKTDTEGNPLKGGEFGIYANADMYIGDTLYKKGQLVVSIKTDDSGVARSDDLPYGSYYVKEISAPTQEAGNSHNFVLSDDTQYVKINGKNKTDSVTFVDKKVTASKTTITGTDEIKGAVMTVTDNDGKVIDTWTSDGNPHSIKGLHEGWEYTLTETTAPKGYVKAESIKFTVSTDKKDQTLVMMDKQFTASKKDASVKNYVEGAKLEVRDEQDRVVDSWTTTKEDHYVSGLEEGKTYRLVEVEAPKGYVKASDIYFTVSKDKKNETVVMKDAKITASKREVTGTKEIEGAKMTVTDDKGTIVDKWTSGKEEHSISGLEEGKRYTLTETTAPKGYVKAESITFTAGDKDQKLVMKDKQVTITKTEVTGTKEIEGAKMTVKDEAGKTVDTWTSGKEEHYVSGLEEGKKYTLIEETAPDGYVKAESIEFTVSKEKKNEAYIMKDKQVTVTKTEVSGTDEVEGAKMTVTDETGKTVDEWTSTKEEHYVSGLEEGKTYTLTETTAPDGYVKAESIEFTVSKDKVNQKVSMLDKQVSVTKTDITGTQEVPGATLTVKDEDGKTVDTWVSGDKEHYVSGLEEGKKYTLIEETAPEGYVRAEEITFTVTNEKVDQEVNMFDAQVKVTKTDALTGDAVKGAEFTVFDKDGNIVDKWTTDGTAHAVSGLDAGKEYIIKETKTPEGYMTAPDRTLVVSGEQNMDLEIKEQPVLTDIEVQKVDAQTKKVIRSKDFEFTMYSDADCKNAITTVSADQNAGTATFKDLRYGTYYIKETKAPTGYLLSKEVKKVVINDNLENVGKTYSFIYQDTPMPTTGVKTGDGTDIKKFTALTGISGIALLACLILIIRKKKNVQ